MYTFDLSILSKDLEPEANFYFRLNKVIDLFNFYALHLYDFILMKNEFTITLITEIYGMMCYYRCCRSATQPRLLCAKSTFTT
jgi:hypothetical protein